MFPTELTQAGACRHRDAVRMLGRHRVRTAIETREFSAPWPGVLVDPARAADPLTVVTAAWFATGSDAVVAGPTAAFLHGCPAAPPTPVHLMAPYRSSKRARTGIVVHNGGSIDEDRVLLHGLPVLNLERAVTDIVCTCTPPEALAVLDQALASLDRNEVRAAFRSRVRDRLRDRPDPRGTRVGARLVDLATGRAASPAESWLLWRIVDLGFPVPEVNYEVCTIDGVAIYQLDLCWPGLRIALEYNGYAAHAERAGPDAARIADLERRGWLIIAITAQDLRNMADVERRLHHAFVRRGMDLGDRTARALRGRQHRERRSAGATAAVPAGC